MTESVKEATTKATTGKYFGHGIAVGLSCFVTAEVVSRTYTYAHVSQANMLLGTMWAVVATVFVQHMTFQSTRDSVTSRMLATSVSVVLCLVYLLLFPFHIWGLSLVIALGIVIVTLLGRPNEIITTGITSTVVLVVAAIAPEHRWEQPILRFIDTMIGTIIGAAGGWLEAKLASRYVAK